MKKKGISMIILIITIIILLTLVATVTMSYRTIIQSTRVREFANELNVIQNAVNQYHFMNGEIPIIGSLSIKLDPYQSTNSDREYQYDILDLSELGITELKRGVPGNTNTLDVYTVSRETGKVFYLAGVSIDEKRYYTLTEELREKLN